MGLNAAEIGEKVHGANAALLAFDTAGRGRRRDDLGEDERVTALVTALMHYAKAYGYDAKALVADAVTQYNRDHTETIRRVQR